MHADMPKNKIVNGAGIAKAKYRAGLAAVAAAIVPCYSHIDSESLYSEHMRSTNTIFKGMSFEIIYTCNLYTLLANICVYKAKSHAGIVGNERADATAKYQAKQANNNVADTGLPDAGPGGNSISHISWLTKEQK
eukprot:1139588-Pelagomonas_calceolata.AAC.4